MSYASLAEFKAAIGISDSSDDTALQPNQMRRATNLRLTDFGAATKRGGTKRTSTNALAAAAVLNGYTWQKDNGTNQIMAVCNGALRTTTYGAFPWTWRPSLGRSPRPCRQASWNTNPPFQLTSP